jgi:hypothetical protein
MQIIKSALEKALLRVESVNKDENTRYFHLHFQNKYNAESVFVCTYDKHTTLAYCFDTEKKCFKYYSLNFFEQHKALMINSRFRSKKALELFENEPSIQADQKQLELKALRQSQVRQLEEQTRGI